MADQLLNDCQAATIEASKSWPAERRTECITLLEEAVRRIGEAISIWEEVLASPDESGVSFTAIVHIGPERSKVLQGLYFEQKALAAKLTEKTGATYRDALGMDDSIAIVQPYDQLGTEESLHERADSAIATLRARSQRLATTIAAL